MRAPMRLSTEGHSTQDSALGRKRGALTSRGGHVYRVCTDKTRVLPAEFCPGPPSELAP
jgi:hypothetical protein